MELWSMAKRLVARPTRTGEAITFASPRRKNRPGTIQPPKISEGSLHRSAAEFLDWVLAPPTVFTTFPAGWGKLPPRIAGQLHASGMKAGMPDILIFYNNSSNRATCVGIELKARGRSQSQAQRSMSAQLQSVGVKVYVCHDLDEIRFALRLADVPCRSRWDANRTLLPLGIELEDPQVQPDAVSKIPAQHEKWDALGEEFRPKASSKG
jgi:hypothetical protein